MAAARSSTCPTPVRESKSLKARSRHPSYPVGSAQSASRAARLQHLFHPRPDPSMTHENDGARPRWISRSITGVTLLILATSALLPRFAGATRHAAQPAFDSAQPAPQRGA